jgi:hypothetical protein
MITQSDRSLNPIDHSIRSITHSDVRTTDRERGDAPSPAEDELKE